MASIMTVVKIIGRLKQLHDICLPLLDPTGQAARWNALQQWLELNPDMQTIIDSALKQEPDQALKSMLENLGIESTDLLALDPKKEFQGQAVATIERLQTIYKERQKEA